MPIMPASVHAAWMKAGVRELVRFGNGQGIHVSPQSDRAGTTPCPKDANHPGAADTAMCFNTAGF
jgi:hypothetical protein